MVNTRSIVLGLLFSAAFLAACKHDQPAAQSPANPSAAAPSTMPMADQKIVAIAVIRPSQAATTQPTDNNVVGTVTFTQTDDGVKFIAEVDGFAPNTKHGFHIHDKGDLSAPNLSSAGPHFNPMQEKHGGPDSPHHHLGDLGNLEADANGHAKLEGVVKDVCLVGDNHCIVGKSVIIHAKEDDLKTDPSGKSGGRIAGGVIVMSK